MRNIAAIATAAILTALSTAPAFADEASVTTSVARAVAWINSRPLAARSGAQLATQGQARAQQHEQATGDAVDHHPHAGIAHEECPQPRA